MFHVVFSSRYSTNIYHCSSPTKVEKIFNKQDITKKEINLFESIRVAHAEELKLLHVYINYKDCIIKRLIIKICKER